jgi:hypothetical protein
VAVGVHKTAVGIETDPFPAVPLPARGAPPMRGRATAAHRVELFFLLTQHTPLFPIELDEITLRA